MIEKTSPPPLRSPSILPSSAQNSYFSHSAGPTTITAADAKNKFGQVLNQAQHEPVHVQKSRRDIAVVISAVEYQRLSAANADSKVSPRVQQLLAESMKQRRSVYEVLAK